MADIFISYSKADRALVVRLSAYLEAEGWKVWWDRSLSAGDEFRDEIMKQIAIARAVIVVWTENSVKSKWVRAEAGVAGRARKLIPTKSPSLPHDDIPLPFGEQHTENMEDLAIVRAAVIAQLAKPAVTQSEMEWSYAAIRNEVVKWSGIVGGSLTLYSHAGATLGFAQWVRLLMERWTACVHAFWAYPFSLVNVQIPLSFSLVCTLVVSLLAISIGERLRSGEAAELHGSEDLEIRFFTALPLVPPLALFSAIVLWPVHDEIVAELSRFLHHQWALRKIVFVLPFAMLSIGPARPMIKRLWFVVIGCLILAALNEVAKIATGDRLAIAH